MKTITPTKLRKKLFPALKGAAMGDSLIVNTKSGPVLITSAGKASLASANMPRINGRIVSDLDTADQELREHLEWPR